MPLETEYYDLARKELLSLISHKDKILHRTFVCLTEFEGKFREIEGFPVPAGSTLEGRLVFQPSNLLMEYLIAFRALDLNPICVLNHKASLPDTPCDENGDPTEATGESRIS